MDAELLDATDDEIQDDAVVNAEPSAGADALVEDELLVEEISIDGMCGVY